VPVCFCLSVTVHRTTLLSLQVWLKSDKSDGYFKRIKSKYKRNPVTGPGGPIGWVELLLNSFLTAALEGGVWSASRPCRLYPRERPGTHCTGGWVGPGAGLDRCGKSRPTGIRFPDLRGRSESLYRLSYPGSHFKWLSINIYDKISLNYS
jgi:hypothetical protein